MLGKVLVPSALLPSPYKTRGPEALIHIHLGHIMTNKNNNYQYSSMIKELNN